MKKAFLYLLGAVLCTGCSMLEKPPIFQLDIPYTESDFVPDAVAEKAPWTQIAPQAVFCRDWQDKEAFPDYQTKVQLCWSSEYLYVLWTASYDELRAVEKPEAVGRGESWGLWKGDAVELFIGDSPDHNRYFEFVGTPLNQWIDIRHNKNLVPKTTYDASWESGWRRAVRIDSEEKHWIAEWSIPLGSITTQTIGMDKTFRGNFYRTATQDGQILYLSWSPTFSANKPSFHVPEQFGTFVFSLKDKTANSSVCQEMENNR